MAEIRRMKYRDLAKLFREAEAAGRHMVGYIVFAEGNWLDKVFSLESRTYRVSSQNKAYMPNMGGYSIYGSALDGSDDGVRLEGYMREERGGEDGWFVDYCYIEVENDGE